MGQGANLKVGVDYLASAKILVEKVCDDSMRCSVSI